MIITVLLLIWSLNPQGAGTVTVMPFDSMDACRAASAQYHGECHHAPGGEIDDESTVGRTLRSNRCEMVAADARVAIWECKGRE